MHRIFFAAFLLVADVTQGDELSVYQGLEDAESRREMLRTYLEDTASMCFAQRAETIETIKTSEDVAERQVLMRRFFLEQLGDFPERTPLNAQTVGKAEGPGFRYEKVIFESIPGFFVTATLYLPNSEPPYPASLVPCGHSDEGKAGYVLMAALLAQNGIAAFCYDPHGQGERYDFLNDQGRPVLGPTLHHSVTGVGCILTGTNPAMYFIWDGMRAIDYLQTRQDIDPDRIGCVGNSGGGTQTSYLMALDPRIKVAAPSCYITTFERLMATIGPQDLEQNIFGQIAYGMDHADYLTMRAPLPVLVCAATRDFFDINGTWIAFREAKRTYTRLGFADRVDIVESDAEHGYNRTLREATAQWLRRWLLDDARPVREEEFPAPAAEELQCTPEGQVIKIPGARSMAELNIERAERLAARREAFWRDHAPETALAKVRELTGTRSYAELPTPEVEILGVVAREGYRIEKIVLRPEPAIHLPGLLFLPKRRPICVVVYCHGENKAADAHPGGNLENWAREGQAILAVDLRGIGETESAEGRPDWRDKCGPDYTNALRAYLLGKSMVGMRTEDILVAAKYARTRFGEKTPIRLHAVSFATVPAAHAAALERDLFDSLVLAGGIPSWLDVVRTPRARGQLVNAVHNALAYYDLPDLLALLPPDRLFQEIMHVPVF